MSQDNPWGTQDNTDTAYLSEKTETQTDFDWLNPFDVEGGVIPLDQMVDQALDFTVPILRPVFQALSQPISGILNAIESILLWVPAPILIILLTLIALKLSNKKIALGCLAGLLSIGLIGAWQDAMTTLSLVLTSLFFCVLIGLPIGIWLSRSDKALSIMRPILDAMQTTPAFVYLIPIVMLFSPGKVAGVVVTIIFAVPPMIRLTNLGIRQVPADLIEAATAFGTNPRQLLFKVQLPLALPTIMAGINQTLMLGLSMVVIASMIAVPGLGLMVLQGIGRNDIGIATVGGLGIVILAIVLDRITQHIGRRSN